MWETNIGEKGIMSYILYKKIHFYYMYKEQISSIYWKEWDTIELGENGSDGGKKIEGK